MKETHQVRQSFSSSNANYNVDDNCKNLPTICRRSGGYFLDSNITPGMSTDGVNQSRLQGCIILRPEDKKPYGRLCAKFSSYKKIFSRFNREGWHLIWEQIKDFTLNILPP